MAQTPAGDVALTGRVVDQADILPEAEEASLSSRLASLEGETTDQLVVVTLSSLRGETIEKTGLALGNGWGVGRAEVDNGVLLIVAPNERKVRIEVGLGLEGLLSDQRAAAIIQNMLPQFRNGRPAQAISIGVSEIETVLRSNQRRPQYRLEKQAA